MKSIEQGDIQIHQLLHGYDDGHRLLAGSIKLDRQSAKTLLALSDLSGQSVTPGPFGYITGYPLPQINAYALARTWLASELSRPGCVWTHTLLIDFTDLVVIGDVALLDLFQRPSSPEDITTYTRPLIAKTCAPKKNCSQFPFYVMHVLLEAIYESSKDCIFVQAQEDIPADDIAMAIWLQQWPRLRRNFRFCTLAVMDRSRSHERFDLQFIPYKINFNSRSHTENRGRWVDFSAQLPKPPKHLMEVVTKDAIARDHNSFLRKFLWRYGAETDAGRSAFMPLAQIWQALERSSSVDVAAAIATLEDIHPPINSLSLRVLQEVVQFSSTPKPLPTTAIEFLVRNLSLLGEAVSEDDRKKVAATIWRHAPGHIWSLFSAKSPVERSVAAAAAKLMQPEEALIGADGDVDLFCTALEANPKLAASPLIWDASAPIPRRSAEKLSNRDDLDTAILHAMLEADNIDVPKMAIDIFGQAAINIAVKYYDSNNAKNKDRASRWLIAVKQQARFLQTAVAHAKVRNAETLEFIASLVSYRSPPVSQSRDEWALALKSVQGDLKDRSFGFCAFLLGRALSGVSPEPGTLIHFSFDPVHNDLISTRTYRQSWFMLERELPKVSWWDSWDRAFRVRLGVVKVFVDRELPPKDFLKITENESVFKKLVDIAASSLAGKDYLVSISSWAQKSTERKERRLINIVESAVR